MNKQQAINLLKNLEQSLDDYCELNEEGKTAFRMAIEALNCSEFPNSSDCISRQAAIDVADAVWSVTGDKNVAKVWDQIKDLPSVQPEWHESPKNALYIRKADAIEICMEQIESPINTYFEKGTAEIIKEKITELPSAQPEIIRCKDCEYGEQDEVGRWFCRSLGCQIGNEDGSGYCADALNRKEGAKDD